MNKRVQAIVLVLFVLAVPFAPNFLASAQETWDISINLVSPLEQKDGMLMKVYFTIADAGAPVMNAQPVGGQIALLNNEYVANAVIKKPDIPIYIALVMDASGSMGGSAETLKNAAKLSLNNIPDDSQFAVIQFDESIALLQDFTDNPAAVSFAIDQYKVSRKGTCLYDAAYTAIESMSTLLAARRAVILFTDGKDENVSGQPCSKHKYQELVDLAMKTCQRVCPYGAPVVTAASEIRPEYCQACGLYAPACPGQASSMVSYDVMEIRNSMPSFIGSVDPNRNEPVIAAFLCTHHAGVHGFDQIKNVRTIPVHCTSRIDILDMLKALECGVDGVAVVRCADETCKYRALIRV